MITLTTRDEVNQEVAEKVMGWVSVDGLAYMTGGTEGRFMCGIPKWSPATDERDTFKVLEHLKAKGYGYQIGTSELDFDDVYVAIDKELEAYAYHKDFKVAACLAALEAKTGNKYEFTGE